MATLGRAKNDSHFFILAGPSKGTQQITEEGINWLHKQPGYRLSPGKRVLLHRGDYRYLDDQRYLYIEGIPYDKHEALSSPPLDDEIEKEGPSLLLQLNRDRYPSIGIGDPWTLIINLDELGGQAISELNSKRAVTITIGSLVSPGRRCDLRWLKDAYHWPKVPPQPDPYQIYYYNSQNQWFQLTTSIPTEGLERGWRGNVFLKFESSQLTNTWHRSRVDEQASIDTCKELYWLAQPGMKPEEWPGTAQPIGAVHQDWQLWRLQMETIDDVWDATRQWLSYRLIHLTHPTWHVRIIDPLHVLKDHCAYSANQRLLLRCDPPGQQSENIPAHTALSLTFIQNTSLPKQAPVCIQLNGVHHNQSNYFYTPVLTTGQEYRIQVQGEATGPAISTHLRPLPRTQPSWLRGLSCTLIGSKAQYTFSAFSNTPEAKQAFNLRVPNDFSLKDFAELLWELEPEGVPCCLTWEHSTLQGEIYQRPPLSLVSERDLNSQWQMAIWPAIADSPWAKITLDAASFGQLVLTLHLKPEQAADNLWWRDERLSASFIWLSNAGERDSAHHTQPVLPALRNALLQLCSSHDLPPVVANALMRLTMRRHMPTWMQLHLQTAVTEIQHKSLSGQEIEQKR